MQIKNYLSLFFFTNIFNYIHHGMASSRDFHFFREQKEMEEIADDILEVFGRLFNNYQRLVIHETLTGRTISICRASQISLRTVDIYTLALDILLFVPAVLFKACLWTFSFNFRQRNRIVLDLLKQQDDFARECDPKSYLFRNKQFSHPLPQNKNSFVCLPKDIQMFLLSCFNRKAIIPFALTCSKNYATASDFNKNLKTDCFPFMREFMADERISQIPHGVLPKYWKLEFDLFLSDYYQSKEIYFWEAREELSELAVYGGSGAHPPSFSSSMQNQPIQKIEMLEGYALIIRIKDHGKEVGLKNTFVIAKKNERLNIVPYRLSPGLWLFLRDLSYHKEVPRVIDYLKRLFNGEPCGNFPKVLNRNLKINYETQKASEILQEGPLFCPDGITSMVQLWPNPSPQNA